MSLSMNLTIPQIRRYWQRGGFRRTQLRADAQSLVSRFSVKAESVDAPLVTLSGGNQQKVIVARWMAIKPTLLLLDEPTQGVDVGARHEIYEIVARAAATDGLAVIVVASDPEELAQASDRVIVLRDGGVATELRGSSITAESIARETHRQGTH
jgi:ribose transport system ATP-binding protein